MRDGKQGLRGPVLSEWVLVERRKSASAFLWMGAVFARLVGEQVCRVGRHGQGKPEFVLVGLSCPHLAGRWAGLVRQWVGSGGVADLDADPTGLLGLAEVARGWGLTLEPRFSGRRGRFECAPVVLRVPSILVTISTSATVAMIAIQGLTYFFIEVFQQCSGQRRYRLGTESICVGQVNAGFLDSRMMGSVNGTPIWRAR